MTTTDQRAALEAAGPHAVRMLVTCAAGAAVWSVGRHGVALAAGLGVTAASVVFALWVPRLDWRRVEPRVLDVLVVVGTLAMAALLAPPLPTSPNVQSVWLTPLLCQPQVRETLLRLGASAQVVIGDADPYYDAEVLTELERAGVNVVVAQGADHGLDIPGDAPGSTRLMSQIVTAVQEFGFRSRPRLR